MRPVELTKDRARQGLGEEAVEAAYAAAQTSPDLAVGDGRLDEAQAALDRSHSFATRLNWSGGRPPARMRPLTARWAGELRLREATQPAILDAVERGRGLQLADVAAIALGGAEVAV